MSISTSVKKLTEPIGLLAGIVTIVGAFVTLFIWYSIKLNSCNINGEWKFTFTIESSSMKAYIGKSAGYKIYIHQNDNNINGTGEKWWVDNIELPYAQHDRFDFIGSDKNKVLNANYTLYGTLKTTEGGFQMKIVNDTVMQGTFSGTAADTRGHIIAVRL